MTPYSQNRYAYVGNNPINRWDPFGYWEDSDRSLSDQAQRDIIAITTLWDATDDPDEKARLHAEANAIRILDRTRIEYRSEKEIRKWTEDSGEEYSIGKWEDLGVTTEWKRTQKAHTEYGIYSNLQNAYTGETVSTIKIGERTDTVTTITEGTDFRPYTEKEWYERHRTSLEEIGGKLPAARSVTKSTTSSSSSKMTPFDFHKIEKKALAGQNKSSAEVKKETNRHLILLGGIFSNPYLQCIIMHLR